jgi:hypothetical protein
MLSLQVVEEPWREDCQEAKVERADDNSGK